MHAISRLVSCLLVFVLVLASDQAFALESTPATALGPEGGWITAVVVSPNYESDGRLWTAVFGGRIFASTDAAANWQESHVGESDPVVEGLAISPDFAADQTIFAAADEGVFRSTDGGGNWVSTTAGLDHHFCRALVVSNDFGSDRSIFVATDGGVYRSSDAGSNWSAPANAARSVISLAQDANGILFAGLDSGGLEKSADGGVHWQTLPGLSPGLRVLGILPVANSSATTILAATDRGIWRSVDGGSSWLTVGATDDRVDTIIAAHGIAASNTVYAGSGGGHGVYASDDAGATWHPIGAPQVPYVTSLAAIGTTGLVAGTTGGGIFMSADSGLTWIKSSHGLLALQTASLRAVGNNLYAAGNGGAYVRNDASMIWKSLGVPSSFVTSLDGRGAALFAGTQDQGLMGSSDAGQTWHRAPVPGSAVSQVSLSPPSGSNDTLLVASDYVYRSTDGGLSFTETTGIAGNDVRSFGFSPTFASDGIVLASTLNHGVFRSSDGGVSWLPASSGLPSIPVTSVLLSPTFSQDRTVYAATAGDGLFVSTSGGDLWSPVTPAVPDSVVDALVWTASGQLVAGTDRGIFLADSGHWMHLADGWDGYVSVLQDATVNGEENLYAGTAGQGVWRTTLQGSSATPTVPITTVTSTSTALPVVNTAIPIPIKTTTPVVIRKPPVRVRTPLLRLKADPVPLAANQPALLSARGPGRARLQLKLDAHNWHRVFVATFGSDGRTAFGFVAPTSTITVVGRVVLHGHTTQVKLILPVPHS